MNEQENAVAQQPEQEVEELEIQVTDQPTDTAETVASSDDELDNYTKSVSKRINKLNERHRAAEEKAARLEAQLRQKEQENAAYVQNNLQTRAALIQKEEEAIDGYYNGNGSDEYGHKTIEYFVVEAIPYKE